MRPYVITILWLVFWTALSLWLSAFFFESSIIRWRANPHLNMEIVSAGSVLAAVLGITQAIKMLGLPSRFAPITSVAVGIAFAMFFLKSSTPETVFAGVVMGLTCSGLWSGSKALLGK